jgi:hypothetical protein
MPDDQQPPTGEFLLYQTEDGRSRIECRLRDETLWLSLNQISELFDRDKSVISKHLKNIFEEGELVRDSVVAQNATTAADGKTYQVDYYRLEAVLAVGYRVRSSLTNLPYQTIAWGEALYATTHQSPISNDRVGRSPLRDHPLRLVRRLLCLDPDASCLGHNVLCHGPGVLWLSPDAL